MTDDEIIFYKREKLKFNELLSKFDWTEDCLLKEQKTLIQCPIDRGHRFPIGSKHVQHCQLVKEGFSKEYLKELAECEQEKQLLNQSGIFFTPSQLSDIVHRPITITNNLPLSIEQATILFSPGERSLIAQAVHNEALRLGIVPSTSHSIIDNQLVQSQKSNISQQLNKLAELRDQKRRPTKYVTRPTKKNFYDIAREMINTEMKFIEQVNHQIDSDQTKHDKDHSKEHKHKHKHKHRSSSKKTRRSSHSKSRKHHRHSKKRRKS
ncbi:unnamed protein product [Rotaria sordida]|uniref:CHHC U11-48K-type domain-containing protein n=1 Tax=Rotaria sordida TaxID=392033 RepID=A0A814WB91_9BILA|nr:unnamed protein product [Rotaria sordida]